MHSRGHKGAAAEQIGSKHNKRSKELPRMKSKSGTGSEQFSSNLKPQGEDSQSSNTCTILCVLLLIICRKVPLRDPFLFILADSCGMLFNLL